MDLAKALSIGPPKVMADSKFSRLCRLMSESAHSTQANNNGAATDPITQEQ